MVSISTNRKQTTLPLTLFYIGIFLIPFDNIPFAPSRGWACISPYIFLLSSLLFLFKKKSWLSYIRATHRTISLLLIITSISIFALSLREIFWESFIFSFVKLILGLSFFFSLCQSEIETCGRWLIKAVKLLTVSYAISLFFGILQYLNINLSANIPTFDFLFERIYSSRVQFTFTEPSFITIHVLSFGLTFICLCYSRFHDINSKNLETYTKSLKIIFVLISILAIISGASLLFALLSAIILLFYIFASSMPIYKKLIITMSGILFVFFMINVNPTIAYRFSKNFSFDSGIELTDTSTAIRYFRTDASAQAMAMGIDRYLFGYGFGNCSQAIIDGFDQAKQNLAVQRSIWSIEILSYAPDSIYNLPFKLYVEFGVLGLIFFFLLIFSAKHILLLVYILLTLLQFDNIAFYSIWIYFYCVKFNFLDNQKFSRSLVRLFSIK